MTKDKQFIKNSIKMDLHRVITAVGDITKPIPIKSVKEFLTHASDDFKKISLSKNEKKLFNQLESLSKKIDSLQDPHNRLIWTEDIMTLRCRI